MTTADAAPAISPSQAVEHALRLLASKPAAAERQAREILKVLPDDSRASLILGPLCAAAATRSARAPCWNRW